ncbi:alpha-N-acetyl-neuraminyl-2,3-beta-galactosyl-1,3-N-acetyl-galactosaminide alpha-2,6-sialyltransferase-like [Anneissia japonica]|uniref:alpha-N-acetyl-neuraminyl-2,3-beta-galactosyl-1, 3-N-acetyl-galactosaminide alpha-2,6-sialyltransferase-like n=1 Tax=Anneissia japonica TaxID=1529436 RepID=UPI00142557BC|nr:alpha-N-acetyl-neuraminyl-2,3-beta-galactosyl-1,3-N-acetyl-galactosaminide alpha-2,6-sialyltransferase-like [Anneissia japonica]XP_033124585.1 alpha-N-acetyl-neuraminyl-2,3-beta-galactosyl-1,3-N-acetyl-galactosaminide alpha-2,6-sialyltransferase-like [Anneissia japonica]
MAMRWLKIKQIAPFLVCGFFMQFMLMIYTFNEDAARTHLKSRHKTVKEVRGPNFHVHRVDHMPIDLRENYEKRRLLNELNRPHIIARRELLSYHRGINSDVRLEWPTEDFLSLRKDGVMLNLQCGTCAVVSNSGDMIGSRLGNVIDDADCVFRLNVAPTDGYELDVGRKTNLRIVSHRSLTDLAASERDLLDRIHPNGIVFHGPSFKFNQGNGAKLVQQWTARYPNTNFYTFSPTAENKAELAFQEHTGTSRASSGGMFSTGWYAVMLAGELCNSTKVYGMVPENHCKNNPDSTTPYSYYNPSSLPQCLMYQYHDTIDTGGYRFNTERAIFKSWTSTWNLEFLNPSWE